MRYDVDPVVMTQAAAKLYGPGTVVSQIMWVDTSDASITVMVTPVRSRSLRVKFYYTKQSFDPKDPEVAGS